MEDIKIIGRIKKNKNLYFVKYDKRLDPAINNFLPVRTVKIFKGYCYINYISLGYFTEILDNNKVSYSVITTLI